MKHTGSKHTAQVTPVMSHTEYKQTDCTVQDPCDACTCMHQQHSHMLICIPIKRFHAVLSNPNLSGNLDKTSQATCPRLTRKSGSRLNLSSNLENHRSSTLLGSTNVSPELPELNDSMYLQHGSFAYICYITHPFGCRRAQGASQGSTNTLFDRRLKCCILAYTSTALVFSM